MATLLPDERDPGAGAGIAGPIGRDRYDAVPASCFVRRVSKSSPAWSSAVVPMAASFVWWAPDIHLRPWYRPTAC